MNDQAAGSIRNYPTTMAEKAISARRIDITLRQNIDEQISHAETRLQELKDVKARFETSAIIDMRIDDIQAAMRW